MKKKIIIVLFLLIFIASLGFLSDFLIEKIRIFLEHRVLSVLPEGSYIEALELKGLTGISADSIYIADLGIIPKIEVIYSPAGILRRRIKKISLDSPSFLIKESERETETGGISALFYLEEVEVNNGLIEWKGHKFEINGSGEIFSTGRGKVVLSLPKLWGKIDDVPFNIRDVDLSISDEISNLDVKNLRIGSSEFEIVSDSDGEVGGKGRVYLSDLEKLFGIKGEGFLDISFAYDTTITFEGESRILSLYSFNLPQFNFFGVSDSVNLKGEKISGFFNFDEGVYGQIKLNEFNAKTLNSEYPDSRLNGLIDFTFRGGDTLSLVSKLEGEILKSPLEDFRLNMIKKGGEIFVDSCKGYYNGGEFVFSGVYKNRFEGNANIEQIDISPITKFFGLDISAVMNLGLSIHEKIYGAFSLKELTYNDVKVASVEGNLNLVQGERGFPGKVNFVTQGFGFKDRKIFELGESNLIIENDKLAFEGFLKSEDKELEYDFSLKSDTIEVKDVRFEYNGGWLYLTTPFFFSYKHDSKLQDIKFVGSRGENFKIDNLSLTPTGVEGSLNLIGFRPEFLNEFGFVSHPFSGRLSSVISIKGTHKSTVFFVEGGGKIKVGEKNLGDSLNFSLQYQNSRMFVRELSIVENGNYSDFYGKVNFEGKNLNMEMELQEAGSWVFYPLIEYLTADSVKLYGDLTVRGDFNEPLVYGNIDLKEADLLLKNTGIEINQLEAIALFEGEEGKLTNISAQLGEGKVRAEGRIGLKGKEFEVDLNLEDTPINWQYVNTIINGDLSISKDRKNIRVEGEVDINRATVTMEFEQKAERGRRPSNMFLDLTFDATQGNVWIRNDMANIELAGKVGVSYEGGPLLLSGNLEVKQGMFYYLYKSFEVLEGEFDFNESPEINPSIGVRAITLISTGENGNHQQDTVFLEVTGTMKVPEFDIYSKTSLSKAELMTLLSLNVGWEDLTTVKTLEQSVGTAFSYWVRQTLSRRLKEEFGIDVLEMQGGGGHYEFIVGKYVTDKLFVKARADLQSYGISEIQAEYKLRRWGYLKAERDFEGPTRFLFNLEWRY